MGLVVACSFSFNFAAVVVVNPICKVSVSCPAAPASAEPPPVGSERVHLFSIHQVYIMIVVVVYH